MSGATHLSVHAKRQIDNTKKAPRQKRTRRRRQPGDNPMSVKGFVGQKHHSIRIHKESLGAIWYKCRVVIDSGMSMM